MAAILYLLENLELAIFEYLTRVCGSEPGFFCRYNRPGDPESIFLRSSSGGYFEASDEAKGLFASTIFNNESHLSVRTGAAYSIQ